MRIYIAIILVLFFRVAELSAQNAIGIGVNTPSSSASLDITSASKGFLIPRLSQTARLGIISPSEGLLVYDSTLHRLYQYQDGIWKYMLTSDYWSRSATRNWTYNSADSIGIGTSIPAEKLDVVGNIQVRNDLQADNDINVTDSVSAASLNTTGGIITDGTFKTGVSITTSGDINLDNPTAILQFQNSAVNKTFVQQSGNDLRFGTNSGNSTGKILFRMNGNDAMTIDRLGNITMQQTLTYNGWLKIGWKICRASAPSVNMLPVIYGFVPGNGSAAGWMSPIIGGSWSRTATGTYVISQSLSNAITPKCVIVATPKDSGKICVATFLSQDSFMVQVYNRSGVLIDGDFTYIVQDPLN